MNPIAAIKTYYASRGIKQTAKAFFTVLGEAFYWSASKILLCISQDDPIHYNASRIPIHIRKADPEDARRLSRLPGANSEECFLNWLRHDYLFYVAQNNGSVVSYICICPATQFKSGFVTKLKLSTKDAWIYNSYTHPEYRGNRIYPALLANTIDEAKKRGFRRIYAIIKSDNDASRRAHGSVGLKEIGLATIVRVCNVKCYRISNSNGYGKYFADPHGKWGGAKGRK